MTRTVLLVDDDAAVREALAQTLELADLEPRIAASFIEAKDHIAADFDGIVLSDIRMPGRDGFFLLDHALKIDGELPVILLTGEGDIPMAVAAMDRGAFGFLEKPCASSELLPVVERALRTRALVLENRRLKAQLETGDPAARMIFGRSEQSQALRRRIRQVAATGADVLVTGAPGAGISKVAEVIHLSSRTAQRPFVKRAAAGMDTAALDVAFQEAAGGSLYLNEIGQLSVEGQFALSERLESSSGTRLIAGATAELEQAVAAGQFSADLFYRLGVMRVHTPALKERPEDIPVMFRQYVAQAAEQAGLAAPEITPEVIAGLMARDWPGNARALMSEAMRFVLGADEAGEEGASDLGLVEQMARIEKSLLAAALRRHEGRAAVVADALKLPRKTLYDKLAKYALKPDDFR
ncbi:sigma-54-dependent Fis family transcriptional regulator [Pseudooceanicola sediminis]|uniref:Sigma-54-dependent Fis family transcriptional regulator n=1 Tax=Pseudooceanicola sediminis TaxID=2211117 RepID=A0A399IYG6_9RHOB|nr:sigma-54 dependent transcriptional regulator [Pseudooceanicola sediminis]KAA2316113.1 sigma-54-dependent Fis family transcriptional regulator [Puniceibacterium sp. HSS470]RII38223.1 sigma-54-dependent Fis family transcriptional regulator [Pseudooceanicola sediminis]|tara:strand:+ start:14288 stop:15517 length:1230 start_codon:yes stop_codon:yes gene_type:complete